MEKIEMPLYNLGLKRVGQLGIVTADLEKTAKQLGLLLNLKTWYRSKIREQEVYYRGKKIDLEMDFLLAYSGGLEIELIGLQTTAENIYSHIHRAGGGLHHLGCFTSRLDDQVKTLQKAGVEVLQHGRIITEGGTVSRYAYFDTADRYGIVLELIESRLRGIPVPHSKATMQIGLVAGDVEKLHI